MPTQARFERHADLVHRLRVRPSQVRAASPGRASGRHASGQALVEVLVIAGGALVVAYLALNMIGHLSDARDRSLMASRYAAWERTVYFDDTSWSPTYGSANTKSDSQIRSEIAQRVLGHDTKVSSNDSASNALSATPEPMWRDVAGQDMLRNYNDLQVSHTTSTTGTVADKSVALLDTLSGIGAGFDLPVKNQQSANVSLRMAYDNPTLSTLWPSWKGVTFSDHSVVLTNSWTPDGSDKAKAMIADAVPTAKGSLIEYGLDALAAVGTDITSLDLGRIQPDVVPQDRLGNK
ncbi:conserved protein of unknown function [Pararobbsia alpina]|uniref:hypothetical protein n=1 Tax=Pararobbsia alpina TaxID=621374 RepID=UPI0039A4151F